MGGKPTDACKKELAACNKNKVCAALHKKLAKAMADSKKGQQGKPQDKKKDTKKQPEKKKDTWEKKPDNNKDKKQKGPDNKDKKKKQQQQGPNKNTKKGKNRQLFADVVKKVMNKNKNAKPKPQPKKDGNNKNKNDNAKPKPQPKKDGNKELDALKKACQKNALCKKLMECKAKAQKGGGGKPTDACKKELAACNKNKVCAA